MRKVLLCLAALTGAAFAAAANAAPIHVVGRSAEPVGVRVVEERRVVVRDHRDYHHRPVFVRRHDDRRRF